MAFRVLAGSFKQKSGAQKRANQIKAKGFPQPWIYHHSANNLYRVQVASYGQKANADQMVARLKKAGIDAYSLSEKTAAKPKPKEESVARMPRNSWWGVTAARRGGRKPYTTTSYRQYLWNGTYPFGCGNSRHHGVDVGNVTGMPIHAWGPGTVVSTGYDQGGYYRWIQIFYPRANATITYGHLRNGTQLRVGAKVRLGTRIAKVGTKWEGINHPHVHFRAAWGKWINCIPPCSDINPYLVWRRMGLK